MNIIFEFCTLELVWLQNFRFDFRDKTFPKWVFAVENWKREHNHWIQHVWIGLATKFQLQVTISFLDEISTKLLLPVENRKKWTLLFSSAYSNFTLDRQFLFLGPSLPKKVFAVRNEKSTNYRWVFHIPIGLSTTFYLKPTTCGLNLVEKGTSWWKQKHWASLLNSPKLN